MATPSKQARVTVQARIDKSAIDYLDKIGPTLLPPATRSALINLAVVQFVDRLKKQPRG